MPTDKILLFNYNQKELKKKIINKLYSFYKFDFNFIVKVIEDSKNKDTKKD